MNQITQIFLECESPTLNQSVLRDFLNTQLFHTKYAFALFELIQI